MTFALFAAARGTIDRTERRRARGKNTILGNAFSTSGSASSATQIRIHGRLPLRRVRRRRAALDERVARGRISED